MATISFYDTGSGDVVNPKDDQLRTLVPREQVLELRARETQPWKA